METGIIILGHGSRAEAAASVMAEIVDMVRERVDYEIVEQAAMELAEPELDRTVAEIINRGVKKIVIIPLFLFPGIHIQEDIPEMIEELEIKYPDVKFIFGKNIGAHPGIAGIIGERIEEAL